MKIIKVTKDIGRLEKSLWESFWKNHGKKMGYQKLKYLIKENDREMGYIHMIITGGIMKVEDIIIAEKHRGNNGGNEIMKFIEVLAKRNKCHKIRLETSPDFMPEAFHLYQKYGFKREAKLKEDMHNKDWVIMSKSIN